MVEKACRSCRLITTEARCPQCNSEDLTKAWEGTIIIVDPNASEVAKAIGAKVPGKYALKIK
jgi:DNA-directed RNA polymerase subunit E"